jgi:hypothetical protein
MFAGSPTTTNVSLPNLVLSWINVAAKNIPVLNVKLVSTAQAPWYFKVRAGSVIATSETGTTIVASGTLANVKSQLEAGGHFVVTYHSGAVVGNVLSSDFRNYEFVANKTTCDNQIFIALKGEVLNPKSGTVGHIGFQMWNLGNPYILSIPNTESAFLSAVSSTRKISAGTTSTIPSFFVPNLFLPFTYWINRYSSYLTYMSINDSNWNADPGTSSFSSFPIKGSTRTQQIKTCGGPPALTTVICGGPDCNEGCEGCSFSPSGESITIEYPAPVFTVSLLHSGGWNFT